MTYRLPLVMAWALMFGAPVANAADLVIERPAFVPGDGWEFTGTENGAPYRWSRTIIEVMPDAKMQVKALRNDRETIETYDTSMNFLVGGRSDRGRQLARYPLRSGGSWTYAIGYENPNAAVGGEAKVVGQERLTVAAGTFDCLKVEATTTSSYARSSNTYQIITRWHCPEIKWIAKEVVSSRTSTTYNPAANVVREVITELVKFTPGK